MDHVQRKVPEAWATLSEDLPYAEKKVRITLRVDESVAKTFRATGPGYQERMNRVLATWAQMQIGEVERTTKGYFELRKEYGLPGTQEHTEHSLAMVANDPPEERAKMERGIVGDACYIGEEGE